MSRVEGTGCGGEYLEVGAEELDAAGFGVESESAETLEAPKILYPRSHRVFFELPFLNQPV